MSNYFHLRWIRLPASLLGGFTRRFLGGPLADNRKSKSRPNYEQAVSVVKSVRFLERGL